MPIVDISSDFINKELKHHNGKKVVFWDRTIKGFVLELRGPSKGTFALRYRDSHNRQCQYKIGSVTEISVSKARKEAEKARGLVVTGKSPSEDRKIKKKVPKFSYFVQFHFIPFIKKDKRSWKTDLSMLNNHLLPRFGKVHMTKITNQDVINFHQSMKDNGYSPGMANRGVKLMRYIYNKALSWEIPGVERNPAAGIKFFEEIALDRFLTADEARRLLEAAEQSGNPQMKNIIALLIFTGARKSELLHSRWEDFQIDRRIWRIPMSKSGKCRHVPLSKAALEVLAQLPRWEGCPYVVPNPKTKKPFVQVQRAWDVIRKKTGLPDVKIHSLRHSTASFLINSGRSIYEVSKILGHSQLKTTQRYAHLSQETLLEAVDAAAEATGTDWG